ncbi:AIPR family protein [Pseudanabaena sp. FACHB-1998]|uniref:AIPR family protein n=1 Tax=Pseudanabaena sp. FACHB-1998 TaxID=2692858 RepID=UPI00168012AC|nr:AIPR family protein [Pseudanabaena sp. FACHB-1998]MBD2178457.1 AIPR family protein [Pseudanabaena sp. FACHB-1998]
MTQPNASAKKTQVIEVLKRDYFPMIPELARNWTANQHEKNRLSRSLAAFVIANLADVTPAQGANSIINGENDNGIDAIYFDRSQNFLWLVQAKAGNAPNMGDNKKFCDGIRDLIEKRFDKFNQGFARLQPDVEAALDINGLKIVGCNVYLEGDLGSHVVNDLNQLTEELNRFSLRFEWRDLNIEQTHSWLTAKQAIAPVDVELTLENWHCLEQPRKAFYGLVKASDLAVLYQQHDKRLFEKNIRYYLGTEDVNSAIAETVREQPSELFYLNNGLTITCSKVELPSGHNQKSTKFTLQGFSVVNGAQTVGAIASVYGANSSISADAKLLVTIIEVGTVTDGIGVKITGARNTQNAVRDVYFAALDPNQERLRQECMVSGVVYHYRPSADRGQDDITIEQAAIALACFSGDTNIVVAAKREVSQLYKREHYYSTLFSNRLSGITLCRYVRIFAYLDGIFAASERAATGRQKMFYRHGRFFILDIFSRRRRNKELLNKSEINLSDSDKNELSQILNDLETLIYNIAESQFASDNKSYLSIFKNLTDVRPLMSRVMQELDQRSNS